MWGISKRMDFEKRVLPELEGLLQTCRCLTGSDLEANRLVEKTVAETYRNWDSLRHDFGGRAPVFSVLTEQYLKSLPPGSRLDFFYTGNSDSESLSDDLLAIILSVNRPNATFVTAVTEDDARLALFGLPPAIRLATVLWFVGGFSYTEIAEIVGVEVAVVNAWLQQGRRQLQQALFALAVGHSNPGWSESRAAAAVWTELKEEVSRAR